MMDLGGLMAFIAAADALIAASTGPLHIASALGIKAIGLYPPIRPMHPGRWAPLGKKAVYLVKDAECDKCRKSLECLCMKDLSPELVKNELEKITSGH
jgi:ADP-heptose:LPS heptosyltransferase